MKKLIFIFILLFIFSFSVFGEEWFNSLKPVGNSQTVTFSKDGKSLYTIVIPNNDYKEAGEYLSHYLYLIFGVKAEVVNQKEFKANTNFISIGNTLIFNLLSNYNRNDLNSDGYIIGLKDNNILIYGKNPIGTLNGVFALLEEDLGCRFWTQNTYGSEETIPQIKDGKLSFVPRKFSPAFITRSPSYENFSDENYIKKNRFHKYDAYGFCHTIFNYIDKNSFKEHPELFGMEDGKRVPHQLCWSNPQVLDMILNKTKELAQKGILTQAIMPEDTEKLCGCDECNRLDIPEGSKSATYINALNTILERLTPEFPDLHIVALAYHDYVTPPKNIKPHKNLTVMICSDSCDWEHPFQTFDRSDKFQNDLKSWIATGADTLTWNYVSNYDHYLLPNPNTLLVADNIKLLKNWGVGGIFLQGGCYASAICDFGPMKTWVWGKLLINPDIDPVLLMKDFIYGYYGECANYVWEYEKLLIDIYEKTKTDSSLDPGTIRWTPDAKIYTKEFINKSADLMDKAENAAKSPVTLKRIKELRIAPDYLRIGRNIGYFEGANNYIRHNFDENLRDGLLNAVNSTDKTLIKLKVRTVAETMPWDGNRKTYIEKWRKILTADDKDITGTVLDKKGWKAFFDNNNEGINLKLMDSQDTSDWETIDAESTWDEQGYPKFFGDTWFKRELTVTADMLKSPNIFLIFDGIDEEAVLYVNGKQITDHTQEGTGMSPFALYADPVIADIKPFVKEGNNDITLMIRNMAGAGGIYKQVRIVTTQNNITAENLKYILF